MLTISLVSQQCKVLESAMLAAAADHRLHSATTTVLDGELRRPAEVLCRSVVRSHLSSLAGRAAGVVHGPSHGFWCSLSVQQQPLLKL